MKLSLTLRDGLESHCKYQRNKIDILYKGDLFVVVHQEAELIYLILEEKSHKSKYFRSMTDYYNFCMKGLEDYYPMSSVNRDLYVLDSLREIELDSDEREFLKALQSNTAFIESRIYFQELFLEETLRYDPVIVALEHGLTIDDLGSHRRDQIQEKIADCCNQNMEWFTETYKLPRIYSEVNAEDIKITDVYQNNKLVLDEDGLIPQYFGWVEYAVPHTLADAILIAHGVDSREDVDAIFQIEDPTMRETMFAFMAEICRRY
jgi:hypothetical protein